MIANVLLRCISLSNFITAVLRSLLANQALRRGAKVRVTEQKLRADDQGRMGFDAYL
jgi:hypothetical protein